MVDLRLDGKVSLVTGGGSGIGEAAAVLMADNGAKVGVLDFRQDAAEKVSKQIVNRGGSAIPLVADVSNPEQMNSAIGQLVNEWGRLDIVFANAGINGVGSSRGIRSTRMG